jgi:hypothetical protein
MLIIQRLEANYKIKVLLTHRWKQVRNKGGGGGPPFRQKFRETHPSFSPIAENRKKKKVAKTSTK